MGNTRRVKKGHQRGMHKRNKSGKKPMCAEQKTERKKIAEADRERSKLDLAKKQKAKK